MATRKRNLLPVSTLLLTFLRVSYCTMGGNSPHCCLGPWCNCQTITSVFLCRLKPSKVLQPGAFTMKWSRPSQHMPTSLHNIAKHYLCSQDIFSP